MRDFQNQAVQEEWDKFRTSVLVRRREREQAMSAAEIQLSRDREARNAERAQRMSGLDETIDGLSAKFADDAVALEYDAAALAKKYTGGEGRVAGSSGKVYPCLGPRAHWLDCTKKYLHDTRPCDAYLTALEKCVNEAIVKGSTAPKAQ